MTIVSCKFCTRCWKYYPVEEFSAHKRSADGLCCWCKACHRAYSRAWEPKKSSQRRTPKSREKWAQIAQEAAGS